MLARARRRFPRLSEEELEDVVQEALVAAHLIGRRTEVRSLVALVTTIALRGCGHAWASARRRGDLLRAVQAPVARPPGQESAAVAALDLPRVTRLAAQRRGGRRATQLLDALCDVYELGLSDKEAGERRGVHPTQVTRARIDVLRFLQDHVTRHAG